MKRYGLLAVRVDLSQRCDARFLKGFGRGLSPKRLRSVRRSVLIGAEGGGNEVALRSYLLSCDFKARVQVGRGADGLFAIDALVPFVIPDIHWGPFGGLGRQV
jgi:hypothetical protein